MARGIVSSSNEAPIMLSGAQLSTWTNRTLSAATYASLDGNSNPGMMRSDSIMFDPSRMIGRGAALGQNATDYSAQRVQMGVSNWFYPVAGVALLLFLITYLRTQK